MSWMRDVLDVGCRLCFENTFYFRISIDSMSADVREWTERISKVRKNVKKADDDLKNQMNAFLKVYVSDIILLNKLQFEKKYLSQ